MEYFTCACYLSHNIFLKEYDLHVEFIDRKRFEKDCKETLRHKGCITMKQFDDVIEKILCEVDRRKRKDEDAAKRKTMIKESYQPLHPHLYQLREEFLHPAFLQLSAQCQDPDVNLRDIKGLLPCDGADQVYHFQVFTQEFCEKLIEELENFEKSDCPKGRPNTMNNYGILLDELGFDENFITPLREKYLQAISSVVYPDWVGESLDSHKAFIVTYKLGQDIDLNYHYDNSEVTLNVSLGKTFTGGELYFGEMRSLDRFRQKDFLTLKHETGVGLLHRGQHMHGASPLLSGERYNMIIWMRSSGIRNHLCPMCGRKPTLIKSHGFGDGFTQGESVNVCSTV